MVTFIVIRGVPHLKPSLCFHCTYNSDNVSLMPALGKYTDHNGAFPGDRNCRLGVFCGDLPCGICKKRKHDLVASDPYYGRDPCLVFLRLFTVCSVLLFFSTALHWGLSLFWQAALTLVIMILPLIIRTSEEALLCCAGFCIGRRLLDLAPGNCARFSSIVLPSAVPGILSGVSAGNRGVSSARQRRCFTRPERLQSISESLIGIRAYTG